GTLIENGIPLLRSLDLVTEIASNRFLELKLGEVRRAVIDGATLSGALQEQKLFPDLLTDMMAVGEQTGHFAEAMQSIADVYERDFPRLGTGSFQRRFATLERCKAGTADTGKCMAGSAPELAP